MLTMINKETVCKNILDYLNSNYESSWVNYMDEAPNSERLYINYSVHQNNVTTFVQAVITYKKSLHIEMYGLPASIKTIAELEKMGLVPTTY